MYGWDLSWSRNRLPALPRNGRCKHRGPEGHEPGSDRGAMAAQVSSFAHAHYCKLRDSSSNTQESLNIKFAFVYSPKAVNWFLDRLEWQS